jgi:hypothetical protein
VNKGDGEFFNKPVREFNTYEKIAYLYAKFGDTDCICERFTELNRDELEHKYYSRVRRYGVLTSMATDSQSATLSKIGIGKN